MPKTYTYDTGSPLIAGLDNTLKQVLVCTPGSTFITRFITQLLQVEGCGRQFFFRQRWLNVWVNYEYFSCSGSFFGKERLHLMCLISSHLAWKYKKKRSSSGGRSADTVNPNSLKMWWSEDWKRETLLTVPICAGDLHLQYSYKAGLLVLARVFYKWTWQAELSGVKERTAASSFPPASLVTASLIPSRHGFTN